MMHFGDHLFFEPLARHLKLHGYRLIISPIDAMKFYFQNLGYDLWNGKNPRNPDLIITKVEFIKAFNKTQNQILFIDTATSKIKSPLCNDIVNKVSSFLGISNEKYNSTPSYLYGVESNVSTLLDTDESYIIFNNYIDSGSIRSGTSHQNSIINFIVKLKIETGYRVIHTGSKKDKENDLRSYDFVDIDLRGITSIADMFHLCSLINVIYNVSFDGFQMHLFFINNKKSFILFRGRFLKSNENFIKNFVNPPFEYSENVNNLIEYL